jgi:leucine dehydrogenase
MAFWTSADWDEHERVELVHDRASGLTAIIALHSTHLGPGAGGTRFWHYADPAGAMKDALRLSRGMSYKNAMAGLPMGGGKAVVLLDKDRTRTPEMLEAFGDAIEALAGRYVTAQDVGASEADMVAIAKRTPHVCGLPAGDGSAGGDPGPFTARGVFLGIKAAVAHKLGKDSVEGVHVAVQSGRGRKVDPSRHRRGPGGGFGGGAWRRGRRCGRDHGHALRRIQPQRAGRDT